MITLTPPQPIIAYAFPAFWVAKEQTALNKRGYVKAVCTGKKPITMKGGGPGYQFIHCTDKTRPNRVWVFTVNQKNGHVVERAIV